MSSDDKKKNAKIISNNLIKRAEKINRIKMDFENEIESLKKERNAIFNEVLSLLEKRKIKEVKEKI